MYKIYTLSKMSKKLQEFFDKFEIDQDLAHEIQNVFIDILVENSSINVEDFRKKSKQADSSSSSSVICREVNSETLNKTTKILELENKKWASKTAQQFAEENNVSLDDFSKAKVTKMDIVEFLKVNKTNKSKKIPNNKCKGITKKGEECNKPGTHKVPESKYHYCFKHFENWKLFEEEEGNSSDDNMGDIDFDPTKELSNNLNNIKIEDQQELNLVDTDDEADESKLF